MTERLGTPRLAVLVGVLLLASAGAKAHASAPSDADLARYVNPFIGTAPGGPNFGNGGGGGNTFPAAVRPFGMLSAGPDTPGPDAYRSGYAYGDSTVRDFSLKHLSGAGCPQYRDFPMMPTTARVTDVPAAGAGFSSAYAASFSHSSEQAQPGFYSVRLNPAAPSEAIDVAIAAATRSALARFSYPAGGPANLLINAGGSATGDSAASIAIDPARHEVSGAASSGNFCGHGNRYTIFFDARFSAPFTTYGTWTGPTLRPMTTESSAQSAAGSSKARAGAYLSFDVPADGRVDARIGLSFVSVENARANADAETGGLHLDGLRAEARKAWDAILGRVRVTGGLDADRAAFYTALYHALIHPSTFSDANGDYAGMDGAVHRAGGFTKYADFSGWDVYRSQIPLLAMLAPDQASDFAQSLVLDAQQSGALPKWSVANGRTGVMVGDPADQTLASAYALGARRFDAHSALRAMVDGATVGATSPAAGYLERPGLAQYVHLGYIPAELDNPRPGADSRSAVWGSAATTLEYSSSDFAISRLAAALCAPHAYGAFATRAGNWRHLIDRGTGYAETRSASGRFLRRPPTSREGFVEGDGAQYTWFVPHDVADLFTALGGRKSAGGRLDRFFQQLNAGPRAPFAYLGNEPTLGTPWLYDWLGEPSKTSAVVRRALLLLHGSGANGLPGNDDLGEMSAWHVFAALGLYPAIPGTDVLALHGPLFPKATLRLRGGTVEIDAPAAARGRPYIHSLSVDGRPYRRSWIAFSRLRRGARLVYGLGSTPDTRWASGLADVPPSFPPRPRRSDLQCPQRR